LLGVKVGEVRGNLRALATDFQHLRSRAAQTARPLEAFWMPKKWREQNPDDRLFAFALRARRLSSRLLMHQQRRRVAAINGHQPVASGFDNKCLTVVRRIDTASVTGRSTSASSRNV
jgi:hypothetical protein